MDENSRETGPARLLPRDIFFCSVVCLFLEGAWFVPRPEFGGFIRNMAGGPRSPEMRGES